MLKTFTKGEKKLLKGLKMEYFQFIMVIVIGLVKMKMMMMKMKRMKKMKKNQEEQKPIKYDYKTLIKQITAEEKEINDEVFKKYFKVQLASDMLVFLSNNKNYTEMKNFLVNLINSGLKDLKEEIKKMSELEIDIEKPDNIVNTVEKSLKFNEQNKKGQGLKILTPQQMLNRLPNALAQLQAGNNSNKLKNEIRQLLHSLYCLKIMTEQVYKSLIGII